jgi:short-subunit dehydrogenase
LSTPPLALITGASAGLGTEFARQLAAQGYDLILTARRQERLNDLASSLQSEYKHSVKLLVSDLSQPDGIQQVADCIVDHPDLELLVNNAGFGTKGRFGHVDPQKHDAMVQVHMTAPVLLSRAAIPGMLARRHGYMINVASMAGFFPFSSVLYGSSKAFLITFTQSLNLELANKGVFVQALCPGFTYTEFHATPELDDSNIRLIPRLFWLTSEQVVRHSIRDLHRHKEISIPGWQYQLLTPFARSSLLNSLVKGMAKVLIKRHLI